MTLSQPQVERVLVTTPVGTPPGLIRRFLRAALFWMFGLAASVLIGSLWGNAVATDRATVAEVAREVATEQVVRERVAGWVVDGLRSVDVVVPTGLPADRVLALPATEQVLTGMVDQVVDAAFAPAGSDAYVDPGAALLPAVPQVAAVLAEEGVPVDERALEARVAGIEPVPLEGSGRLPVTSLAVRVSTALTLAAVLAGAAMVVVGGGAVAISPDRVAALGHLAYRLTLTALSLAVMLRLGAWLADPSGGASPWRSGLSTLLASNSEVPFLVAGTAAAFGIAAMVVHTRQAPQRPSRSRNL